MTTTTARLFIGRHTHKCGDAESAPIDHRHDEDGRAQDRTANPVHPVPAHNHTLKPLAEEVADRLAKARADAEAIRRRDAEDRTRYLAERVVELGELTLGAGYARGLEWHRLEGDTAEAELTDPYGGESNRALFTATLEGLTFLASLAPYSGDDDLYLTRPCPNDGAYTLEGAPAEDANHTLERYKLGRGHGDGLMDLAHALEGIDPPAGGTGWWCPTCSFREYEEAEERRAAAPPSAPSAFFTARADLSRAYPQAVTDALRMAELAVEEVDRQARHIRNIDPDAGTYSPARVELAIAAAQASRALAAIADHEERRTQTYRPEE
jgi:hypothetical protein